ncbi:MAG: DMT family transporter [Flavicella sp.]
MAKNPLKNLLELNLSILLISSAGVLVRFIELDPTQIAFWRGFIALFLLGGFVVYQKKQFQIEKGKDRWLLFISTIFFGLHWYTYFYALQVSSVAIGMLSLYTFPVLTALLEPLYFKTKFNKRHLLLALIVLVGLYLMAPEIDFSDKNTKGVLLGVMSAFFFAFRNLTMKKNSQKYETPVLMFYQFLGLAIGFGPFLWVYNTANTWNFLPYLIGLSIFATAIGHNLFIKSFRNFNISTASIISSAQPVYGIVMGFVFLNEMPNFHILIGGLVILSTVFVESYYTRDET